MATIKVPVLKRFLDTWAMISLMHRFYQEIDKALKAHENPDILPQTALLWRFTIRAMALEGNADILG